MATGNSLSTLTANFPSPAPDIPLPYSAQFFSTCHHLAYYVFTYLFVICLLLLKDKTPIGHGVLSVHCYIPSI